MVLVFISSFDFSYVSSYSMIIQDFIYITFSHSTGTVLEFCCHGYLIDMMDMLRINMSVTFSLHLVADGNYGALLQVYSYLTYIRLYCHILYNFVILYRVIFVSTLCR